MKKSFKKTGAVILTMAMVLSMGAMTSLTASAAGETITVATATGLKEGDKVNVYKVATKSALGWAWEDAYKNATGMSFDKLSFEDYSDQAMKLATTLAKVQAAPTTTGTVGTAINVDPGYYLVTAAPSNAGFVAQPMLIEVKAGEKPTISHVKTSQITLTKVIEKVSGETSKVANGGKSAEAASGDVVHYVIQAQIPSYSPDATTIQDFVLTDTCDPTLTISSNTISVCILDEPTSTSGTEIKNAVSDTGAQTFKVTLGGEDVKSNGGKILEVQYDAVLGEDPTISKNLGAADRSDANKNDVVLTYGNNYSTGGGSDTDGDGDVDEDDDQPELKDFADVYTSLLKINKTLAIENSDPVPAGAGDAGFALYSDADCTKVVREEIKTDADGVVAFKGIAAGTYYLKEKTTPDGYKTAAVVTVNLTVGDDKAVYVAPTNFTAINDGGFEITIENPLLETLPATGGIGSVIFTVSGAAIVLLAGVLFVIYMKKRKAEE